MKIVSEKIENPENRFWIWNEKITNKQDGRIYPSSTSNVASGVSVAVYKIDDNNEKTQIAQLAIPDYEKLRKNYLSGEKINLDYTYIDDFSWLGNHKPYEIEGMPYTERKGFTARCSIWHNTSDVEYQHLMYSKIAEEDLDFSYAGLYNLKFCLTSLRIEQGNIEFNNAHIYQSDIAIAQIECRGTDLFSPEISFRYIKAHKSKIDICLMVQKLNVDFLCAKTSDTKVDLDALPSIFGEMCFVKSAIDEIKVTNAKITLLDIREAETQSLEFLRCEFFGVSRIAGNIQSLAITDCINSNIISLEGGEIKKVSFLGTLNNGKIYFRDFRNHIKNLYSHEKSSEYAQIADQMLMLKENFRQTGEYYNEDLCHLQHQKMETKCEKNILKKVGRYILDGISGYGTKPMRMFGIILLTILAYGSIYYFCPFLSYHGANSWFEHIYVSGITFFAVGYGDVFPLNLLTKIVSLGEAFLGVAETSYFLVLLSRKVIR